MTTPCASEFGIIHDRDTQPQQCLTRCGLYSLVENGQEAVLRVLKDPGENSTRLRQSSPFAGVLSDAERAAIYRVYGPVRWMLLPKTIEVSEELAVKAERLTREREQADPERLQSEGSI